MLFYKFTNAAEKTLQGTQSIVPAPYLLSFLEIYRPKGSMARDYPVITTKKGEAARAATSPKA